MERFLGKSNEILGKSAKILGKKFKEIWGIDMNKNLGKIWRRIRFLYEDFE